MWWSKSKQSASANAANGVDLRPRIACAVVRMFTLRTHLERLAPSVQYSHRTMHIGDVLQPALASLRASPPFKRVSQARLQTFLLDVSLVALEVRYELRVWPA